MLVHIPLDLQILICTLLHPSDILALRETCKNLQLATRKRIVWVTALHRVCIDNSLFLPSFPILNMSDTELENAAMGPLRWIELCAAFERQYLDEYDAQLHPRRARVIEDSSLAAAGRPKLFIVPGGRYMMSYSCKGIHVWDLGYTSTADCKLIASVGPEDGSDNCMIQATPDGMGLIILSSRPYEHCSVYEIYPQSETPQLTHIAHLDFNSSNHPRAYLLPDRVVWYGFYYRNRIVFRVWDYRANHSISFSADVDAMKFKYNLKVIATKTSIFILCEEEILIWAIPPLLPQPPDFSDYNPTRIPSLFGIAFPRGALDHTELHHSWHTMSHWYFGSSQHLYFDILCRHELHRFKIIVKPDPFDTSLHLINTEPHGFHNVTFQPYSICEDALVACWHSDDSTEFGAYTGVTSSRSTPIIWDGDPPAKMLLPPTEAGGYHFFLCPTSGRYVYIAASICRIVVVDLF